ncbi:MAG: glycosyltransferase [Ornithinimicrobium sp.]|uniref:glycosyltransferase family 2 protein n=1 Tax=Ornithinimicrobium sp. TaxID=1977084 RepID=UPI0026DFECA8|nr:glycosyltransferase [Ornithinimicrobium sp.]MDO5741239.1 glycosyltransferase [Ornithinimicrobium sp.]
MTDTRSPDPAKSIEADDIDVSVIVPVYNAMPYLSTLLRSLVDQDMSPERYEIVVVDDGSTDEGPALMDGFAERHPQFRIVHQANSGWPGFPRNRGLDLARGRYVFFADADDELGAEALRRMVEFADLHETDVLLPKMVGKGGRWVRGMYGRDQVDADLEEAFLSLTPQKLFRRRFLLEHDLRFPEEKVRLEDGIFLADAYLKARRVSIVGGYDFYHLVSRDDGQNISSQPFVPAGYTWSIAEISRKVRENDPDPARAERIILDLYRRKCLKFYESRRLLRMPQPRRQAFLEAHADYIDNYITREMEDTLQEPFRSRSRLVRKQDEAGLLALARAGLDRPLASAALVTSRWRRRGDLRLSLEVQGGIEDKELRPMVLQLAQRGGAEVARARPRTARLVSQDGTHPALSVLTFKVKARVFRSVSKGVLDVALLVDGTDERARVATPLLLALPGPRKRFRPYATVQGNFSVEMVSGSSSRGFLVR